MKSSRQATLDSYFSRMGSDRLSLNWSSQKKKQANVEKNESNKDNKVQLEVSGSESQEAVAIQKKKQTSNDKKQQERQWNVQFYLNKRSSEPSGDFVDGIHKKWWGDYNKLQQHHGFIQWLFPNSFQSRFNRMANPLSLKQAKQFRDNIEIAKRYQTSYMMMLEFYGMKLKCKQTGQIARSRHPTHRDRLPPSNKPFYEQRFHKTFLTSFHNHMRITRILSSLVMCGFGRYARQLSLFLDSEINTKGGALQQLKKYGVYQREWRQYSEYVEKESERNILLKNYQKNGKM